NRYLRQGKRRNGCSIRGLKSWVLISGPSASHRSATHRSTSRASEAAAQAHHDGASAFRRHVAQYRGGVADVLIGQVQAAHVGLPLHADGLEAVAGIGVQAVVPGGGGVVGRVVVLGEG